MTSETSATDQRDESQVAVPDEAVPPASTFQSRWDDLTHVEMDDLERMYREAGKPPIRVYSQLKGDVHARADIHARSECLARNCRGWQPAKSGGRSRDKVRVIEDQVQEDSSKPEDSVTDDSQGGAT